jgi:hypothetical protein
MKEKQYIGTCKSLVQRLTESRKDRKAGRDKETDNTSALKFSPGNPVMEE